MNATRARGGHIFARSHGKECEVMPVLTIRGRYLPRYRISTESVRKHVPGGTNGVKTKAVQAPDDDPLTLALKAAQAAGGDAVDIDSVHFATATPVYAYGSVTPLLTEALGLDESIHVRTYTGSDRVGTAALAAASDAAAARSETALVVAADAPTPAQGSDREKTAGAGAAAVLIEPDGEGLAVMGRGNCTRNLLESWQAPNEGGRHDADNRFARDVGYVESHISAIERALDDADWVVEDIDALAVNQPNPRSPERVARGIGVSKETLAEPSLARDYGNLGSASALSVLASADVSPDDRVVVASYGAGVADAICLRANGQPPPPAEEWDDGEELNYVEYLQHIEHLE